MNNWFNVDITANMVLNCLVEYDHQSNMYCVCCWYSIIHACATYRCMFIWLLYFMNYFIVKRRTHVSFWFRFTGTLLGESTSEWWILLKGPVMCHDGLLLRLCFTAQRSWLSYVILTHWDRDEMDNISQTTFSSVFSSMKMFEFRLQVDWSLFPMIKLTIFQHWLK